MIVQSHSNVGLSTGQFTQVAPLMIVIKITFKKKKIKIIIYYYYLTSPLAQDAMANGLRSHARLPIGLAWAGPARWSVWPAGVWSAGPKV